LTEHHFTKMYFLQRGGTIQREGLKPPDNNNAQLDALVDGVVWFLPIPMRLGLFAKPWDRSDCRLTCVIPVRDKRLTHWRQWLRKNLPPYQHQQAIALNEQAGKPWRSYWIYFGAVPGDYSARSNMPIPISAPTPVRSASVIPASSRTQASDWAPAGATKDAPVNPYGEESVSPAPGLTEGRAIRRSIHAAFAPSLLSLSAFHAASSMPVVKQRVWMNSPPVVRYTLELIITYLIDPSFARSRAG
jgi:hypothetical protein